EFFTWERVAKLTERGYERALEMPLVSRRPRVPRAGGPKRKRLAVVTPWPGQSSPAAEHSRLLVERLAEHPEVDAIVPAVVDGVELDRSLAGRIVIRSGAQFEWIGDLIGYDRHLYVLDSSREHLDALEGIMRVPGVVLTHDVRLLDLYRDAHQERHS